MDKIVYHGSPNGSLETIKAQTSTHQQECIYATDNKVVAMLFMGRGNGDLDTIKSYSDGIPILVERRPNVLEKLYDKEGYIYELDGTTFHHYDYLWTPEVISFEKQIKTLKKEYYENILKELKRQHSEGKIKIYEYPNRLHNIPLDNSDLIDQYIEFYNQGITTALDSLLRVYPEFKNKVEKKIREHIKRK